MTTGLYFPHTICANKTILKNALFLFDELEYIVPYKGFSKKRPAKDPEIQRALEFIGQEIVPDPSEKREAHEEIEKVVRGNMADKLNFRPSKKPGGYLIFPQKFEYETWMLLKKQNLARQLSKELDYDFAMTQSLGHFMMAMLAVACSGDKKQKRKNKKQLVTEYPDAFKALYLASGDDVRTSKSNLADVRHRLLNIRLKSFDFSKVPFSRLLELREKEEPLLADLRENYLNTYNDCLAEIEEVADNPREIDSCIRRYTRKAERDLKELKLALRRNAASTLLSSTVISTVAGIASETIVPSSGFLASSAVLTGQLVKYRDKRRELLKKHQFAWLYETGTRFKLY